MKQFIEPEKKRNKNKIKLQKIQHRHTAKNKILTEMTQGRKMLLKIYVLI